MTAFLSKIRYIFFTSVCAGIWITSVLLQPLSADPDQWQRGARLAVIPFTIDQQIDSPIGDITSIFITYLGRNNYFQIIESQQIVDMATVMQLDPARLDQAQRLLLAEQLNAEILINGKITQFYNLLNLDLVVYDVADGDIGFRAGATLEPATFRYNIAVLVDQLLAVLPEEQTTVIDDNLKESYENSLQTRYESRPPANVTTSVGVTDAEVESTSVDELPQYQSSLIPLDADGQEADIISAEDVALLNQSGETLSVVVSPEEFFFEMVKVEGGNFIMGSLDGDYDERPQRQISLDTFYISAGEVNQQVWQEIMAENPSYYRSNTLPVDSVNWMEIIRFCNLLSERADYTPSYQIDTDNGEVTLDIDANGYRLPTEAEWEFAARGGLPGQSENRFSGSFDIEQVAWYQKNSDSYPHTPKLKEANELGIYDMSGNILEWCWDYYNVGSLRVISDTNPTGVDRGDHRVARGGFWGSPTFGCRVSNRFPLDPERRYSYVGFRVVRRELVKQ